MKVKTMTSFRKVFPLVQMVMTLGKRPAIGITAPVVVKNGLPSIPALRWTTICHAALRIIAEKGRGTRIFQRMWTTRRPIAGVGISRGNKTTSATAIGSKMEMAGFAGIVNAME